MHFRFIQFVTLIFLLACHTAQPIAAARAFNPAGSVLETSRDWRTILPGQTTRSEHARVQVYNGQLSLSDTVHIQVETLHGTLVPSAAAASVPLEDFSAFEARLDHARVRIADAVLQTLVQNELQASGSPLRIDKVRSQPDSIQISGDIKRLGLWIPFSMDGVPTVRNAQEVSLIPSSLKVAGVPVYKALLGANVQLQSLIDMKSKAVVLDGQAMVLRLQHVLESPRITFDLHGLTLGSGHVELRFGATTQAPPYFCKTDCPGNFVYTEGGELRAFGMVLSGQSTLVTGISTGALPVKLHALDELLSTSNIQLRDDGAIWISAQEGRLNDNEFALLTKGEQAIAKVEYTLGAATNDEIVTLAVHRATLMSPQGIELRVEKLLASTRSTDLGQLPTSAQTVHVGEIALTSQALNAMMNKALFNFQGSPIRRVNAIIGDPELELALQVKPSLFGIPLFWLPATLRGELRMSTDQLALEFTPAEIHMFGLSVLPAIEFLGLQLDDLIEIRQTAVNLQGNTLHIAFNKALPPLQLNTRLQSVQAVLRTSDQPHLLVRVGTQPLEKASQLAGTLNDLPHGLWMNTPEFTALGMRTGPTLGHVYSESRDQRLLIDLAEYPGLLGEATLRLPKPEKVWVSMPTAAANRLQDEGQRR